MNELVRMHMQCQFGRVTNSIVACTALALCFIPTARLDALLAFTQFAHIQNCASHFESINAGTFTQKPTQRTSCVAASERADSLVCARQSLQRINFSARKNSTIYNSCLKLQ